MQEQKYKILIVDDEPDILNTLSHFLTLNGYRVKTAEDGEWALAVLEKEVFDIVLLDIVLPTISGTELAKIIREKYPSVKIVIVTGYPSQGEIVTKGRTVDYVFLKPIIPHKVLDKIIELLNPEISPPKTPSIQKTKVRTIVIIARILLVESDDVTCETLKISLSALSSLGEIYEIDVAKNKEEVSEKIEHFNPEILLIDADFLKQWEISFSLLLTEKKIPQERMLSYYREGIVSSEHTELERLKKEIGTTCLKNGLFQIKWLLIDD